MSAYLVEPEHIAELVKWAFLGTNDAHCFHMIERRPVLFEERSLPKAIEAAQILAQANIDSIKARYPNDPDMLADNFVEDVLYHTKRMPNRQLSAADIWNMCGCLDYQSCEVSGWALKDAYWIIKGIEAEAGRVMAKQAPISWSYSIDGWCEHMRKKQDAHNAAYAEYVASKEAAQ